MLLTRFDEKADIRRNDAAGDIVLPYENKNKAPSLVSTATPAVGSGFTLGLDLGDRAHHVCVLDAAGQMIREASLPNTRAALAH